MNIKFSQLPVFDDFEAIQNNVGDFNLSIPGLLQTPNADNANVLVPLFSIYAFISADKIPELITLYNSACATLINTEKLAKDVFNTYSRASATYFLNTDPRITKWESNFSTTKSISANSVSVFNYTRSVSSNFCFSDITNIPGASAIKNMVAITQANFEALTFKDPQTFYVIAGG
jgi:hypothetical protein